MGIRKRRRRCYKESLKRALPFQTHSKIKRKRRKMGCVKEENAENESRKSTITAFYKS